MSLSFTPDITTISLILSAAALGIVIFGIVFVFRELRNIRTMNNSLDASALVGEFGERQKHLEQRIIDEKVRLEILELRLSKQQQLKNLPLVRKKQEAPFDVVIPRRLEMKEEVRVSPSNGQNEITNGASPEPEPFFPVTSVSKKDALAGEILESVAEGGGKVTARQIQQKIGRSREHTARMMNLLYRQGLVSRDLSVRPFTYSITSAGERELNGGNG